MDAFPLFRQCTDGTSEQQDVVIYILLSLKGCRRAFASKSLSEDILGRGSQQKSIILKNCRLDNIYEIYAFSIGLSLVFLTIREVFLLEVGFYTDSERYSIVAYRDCNPPLISVRNSYIQK